MKRAGVIGLGDMGSGLAKNLVHKGFETTGFDVSETRMAAFRELGGRAASGPQEVGEHADAVFVMVMNGAQANEVILGPDGLIRSLKPGAAVILTATIHACEARALAVELRNTEIELIDAPVTGGFAGAQGGTLTLMAAAPAEVLAEFRPVMEAVAKTIHHVGDEAGQGQTVKACLQTLIGGVYTATFETSVLAAKAGVPGQVLYDVISTSGASSPVVNTALANIIDRKFENTGSHIRTMHKDLTIVLDLARALGVPLFTAATAMQLFEAGKARFPESDNWAVTRILEEIVGAALTRAGGAGS